MLANRIWQHLFGEGIVRSVDNLGMSGELPTHPELLDYLATRVVANEWSVKKLIREMVLSRTYQMSAAHDEKNYEADRTIFTCGDTPHVERMPRRYAMRSLFASGKLDLTAPEGSAVESSATARYGRGRFRSRLGRGDTHPRCLSADLAKRRA
ncbi:MAG: DUF1553 domain-containing protein [Planctomycetaceae bacterium]|nr:DUF1553 domain-containing protein [Planctomycetaceae bacterium]